MKMIRLLLTVAAVFTIAMQLHAQTATSAPVYTQTVNYIKVAPGKGEEWLSFVRETSMKVGQMRANQGEIISWTLLRSVYPAGQEARADYMISVVYEGGPHSLAATNDELYKKAGVAMKTSEISAKRATLSSLVASEMWRQNVRVGAPAKGHYLFVNYMKVLDTDKYTELETKVWAPMAQEWVQQGAMSGWIYSTKILPSGSETTYTAKTADVFPTMEAAFKSRDTKATFEKVVAGRKYEETFAEFSKIRDLARRELWTVVERVTKQ
jgi:hypothetical protein